eukprot:m.667829 g.667829  ORF g.667829 m.667829 type:complete len:888 (-) comp58510_c0_seq10:69-2732(-)
MEDFPLDVDWGPAPGVAEDDDTALLEAALLRTADLIAERQNVAPSSGGQPWSEHVAATDLEKTLQAASWQPPFDKKQRRGSTVHDVQPYASRLKLSDMALFGEFPMRETLFVSRCEHCSRQVFLPALLAHQLECQKKGKSQQPAAPQLFLSAFPKTTSSAEDRRAAGTSLVKPTSSAASATLPPPKAKPVDLPLSSATDSVPEAPAPVVSYDEFIGDYDFDEICGVITPGVRDGKPCMRSLTCKSHSLRLKKLVPRSASFTDLLDRHLKIKFEAKILSLDDHHNESTPISSSAAGRPHEAARSAAELSQERETSSSHSKILHLSGNYQRSEGSTPSQPMGIEGTTQQQHQQQQEDAPPLSRHRLAGIPRRFSQSILSGITPGASQSGGPAPTSTSRISSSILTSPRNGPQGLSKTSVSEGTRNPDGSSRAQSNGVATPSGQASEGPGGIPVRRPPSRVTGATHQALPITACFPTHGLAKLDKFTFTLNRQFKYLHAYARLRQKQSRPSQLSTFQKSMAAFEIVPAYIYKPSSADQVTVPSSAPSAKSSVVSFVLDKIPRVIERSTPGIRARRLLGKSTPADHIQPFEGSQNDSKSEKQTKRPSAASAASGAPSTKKVPKKRASTGLAVCIYQFAAPLSLIWVLSLVVLFSSLSLRLDSAEGPEGAQTESEKGSLEQAYPDQRTDANSVWASDGPVRRRADSQSEPAPAPNGDTLHAEGNGHLPAPKPKKRRASKSAEAPAGQNTGPGPTQVLSTEPQLFHYSQISGPHKLQIIQGTAGQFSTMSPQQLPHGLVLQHPQGFAPHAFQLQRQLQQQLQQQMQQHNQQRQLQSVDTSFSATAVRSDSSFERSAVGKLEGGDAMMVTVATAPSSVYQTVDGLPAAHRFGLS